eukprot:5595362-Pyramimonas_sp.AAC.2
MAHRSTSLNPKPTKNPKARKPSHLVRRIVAYRLLNRRARSDFQGQFGLRHRNEASECLNRLGFRAIVTRLRNA